MIVNTLLKQESLEIKNQSRLNSKTLVRRSLFVRLIKVVTDVDLSQLATKYFYTVDRWIKTRGKRDTVLRLGKVYHCALNYYLNQDNPEYPFLKTIKGFPFIVKEGRFYKDNPKGIQAVLTLLGYYRTILAPGIPNLDSITEPGKDIPENLITNLISNAPSSWNFDIDDLEEIKHHLRFKTGPSGPSVKTLLMDLKALEDDSKLLEYLVKFIELSEKSDNFLSDLEYFLENNETKESTKNKHSIISIKRELGGKDRPFAIVDYWSQCALKPLHDKLLKILRTIHQDSTFDQGEGAKKVKEWSKGNKPIFSLDLSKATDRFPAQLQMKLLGKISANIKFAEMWYKLMTQRDFSYRGKRYRWSVGQPLGAYSSWAMFTLTHHLVVLSAAKIAKVPLEYVILGDDIVLRGKELSEEYIKIMDSLGVSFSLTKSVTSIEAAEFAKRLFYKGHEVSPIPGTLMTQVLLNGMLSLDLFHQIILRGNWSLEFANLQLPDFINSFKGLIPEKELVKMRSLLLFPFPGKASRLCATSILVGHTNSLDLKDEEIQLLELYSKYNYLIRRYNAVMKQGDTEVSSQLNRLELVGVTPQNRFNHPAYSGLETLRRQRSEAHRALGKLWSSFGLIKSDLNYPSINLISFESLTPSFKKRRVEEGKARLEFTQIVFEYNNVKALDPTMTVKKFTAKKFAETKLPTVS